jgi:hypothetical protein
MRRTEMSRLRSGSSDRADLLGGDRSEGDEDDEDEQLLHGSRV